MFKFFKNLFGAMFTKETVCPPPVQQVEQEALKVKSEVRKLRDKAERKYKSSKPAAKKDKPPKKTPRVKKTFKK